MQTSDAGQSNVVTIIHELTVKFTKKSDGLDRSKKKKSNKFPNDKIFSENINSSTDHNMTGMDCLL